MFCLATKEAYDAKQKAYKAMVEARTKVQALNNTLNTMYIEIGQMQSDYNLVNSEAIKAREVYNTTIESYDERIADIMLAIREAKDLKEQFERKINEDESECRKNLYQKTIGFLKKQEIQLNDNKKALIKEKSCVKKPKTPERDELLQKLKNRRAEHARLTNEYHNLKEESARKHVEFKQAQAHYYELKNSEKITFEEKDDVQKIDALKRANIPEEFWNDAIVDFGETETHIYYGGDKTHAHGHVVLNNGTKSFVRKPHEFNMKIS